MLRTGFKKILGVLLILAILPSLALADALGQNQEFFVEPIYDEFTRNSVTATLRKISPKAYFYFDDKFWNSLSSSKQTELISAVDILAQEFEQKIYPTLTSNFGTEWLPGIDQSEKVTLLIHPMGKEVGGYFDSSDEYSRIQAATSNQREMVYLNSEYITKELVRSYLAHEFTHLITFNQKDVIQGVSEEVWLNESRAEYASTLLGYDQDFKGSNLEMRLQEFLKDPSDPLAEWQNKQADYGVIALFSHYLVDHYGVDVLADSLKSAKIGIPSLEQALKQNGFSQDFSQVFTDWAISSLVNDCSLGEKYCYKDLNLKEFTVTPLVNYLPLVGKSSLFLSDYTKEWAGNWLKIMGGKGVLKFEFSGEPFVDFHVPYVITQKTGQRQVGFLELDKNQKAVLYVEDFNTQNTSLTIIPLAQTKKTGFGSNEPAYQFSFTVSTVEETPGQEEKEKEEEAKRIKELLAKVAYLQQEIVQVQAKINAILAQKQKESAISCKSIEKNLFYGLQNDGQVKCLQEFLKAQGLEIYPEGLATGNFFSLTKQAVIRFQEKYNQEILAPLGLNKGTGFVGPSTRAFINTRLNAE